MNQCMNFLIHLMDLIVQMMKKLNQFNSKVLNNVNLMFHFRDFKGLNKLNKQKMYINHQFRGQNKKLYQNNPVKIQIKQGKFIIHKIRQKGMIKSIQGYSYKINQHIGKGYSSTVHKGKMDSTGEQVSIKVIEMGKLEDPINHMLLQYQVAALKFLTTSTNVLRLYDVYATKNNTYIITQLMQGDLHNLLKQRKQFPYYEACEITKQIITGYYDVFKNGYLHRDIKPANIFYKNGAYKIGDFGFAIPAKDFLEHRHYNVGSPVYMPPEALKDNKYSHSCDTWAIGVIFYQLLKGIVPWRAVSEQKLYDKVMTEPLAELTLGLPEVARTFLSRLLNLDTFQRMTPEELITWPNKLFAVEIRSMTPSHTRQLSSKPPLQEISLITNKIQVDNLKSAYSRSKSYSSNQVPNYVSGLRINLPSSQQNTIQTNQKTDNNIFLAPLTCNNINNTLSQINIQTNFQSTKITEPSTQNFSQKASTIFMPQQKKEITEFVKLSTINSPQIYALNIISYIKFIHRIVKFISQPTEVPLKDLELSLVRTMFKEIQRVSKFADPENLELLGFPGWRQFIKTKEFEEKFSKKLYKLSKKYKLFNPLPANEFILQVYKEQLMDGIHKIYEYLTKTQNPSLKAAISLDLLTTYFQVWSWCQSQTQTKTFNFAIFLDTWKFDELMEQDVYKNESPNVNDIKMRLKTMGLTEKQEDWRTKMNFGQMIYPHQELIKMR